MHKRYFFFDIDGTLTDIRNGSIVPSGMDAIRELEAKGHFVAVATGRAYYKAKGPAEEMGFSNMVANGGAALVVNKQLIRNKSLDYEPAMAIIKEADELGYGILVSPSDSIDVVMINDLFIEQAGERREPTNYIHIDSFDQLDKIYKIYISIPEGEEHRLTRLDTLGHMRFEPPYIMYQFDDKDQGIRDMMAYLEAPIEDVVVFGDGENDMVMFSDEWTSIAMGNGYPALLEKADYITSASYEDGIQKACKYFGWID